MRYGVKTAPGRFITWCDDKWYETIKEDYRPYDSKEEALAVIKQLVEHFQYHVVLVSDEGEETYDFGKHTTNVPVSKVKTTCEDGDFFLL